MPYSMNAFTRRKPRMTRRTLLKAGLAGGAALVVARWLYTQDIASVPAVAPRDSLDASARGVIAAIVPVLLAGALPVDNASAPGVQVIGSVVTNVERAVAGLPPAVRKEIDQLFALLSFAPSRSLLAGVWSPWSEASPQSIAAFLSNWRDSRFALQRSAYGALHQLIMAAWYGSPEAWPAIGYPGPPSLAIS
jgi:hypothetical protein